jgi:hypothetical protein
MSANAQLHTNNQTFLGRYWTEHCLLRRYVPSDQGLAILSFGCSTGEELATLRALFPGARLFGCDVDWHNLQAARALAGDTAAIFFSSNEEIQRHGPFDVIVCNSVLLRPTSVQEGRKRGIEPALWLAVVDVLDAALKPGGLLQIINSNIPFRCHPAAAEYEPLRSPLILGPNFVDQFDLAGRHLCSGVAGAGWSGLLSRHWGEEAWPELRPTDFQDVHFQKRGGQATLTPIQDEAIPNLPPGDCWATGTMTYRPHLTPDPRPSTHTEIDLTWTTVGVDGLRLNRSARRIWFDGSVCFTANTVVEMTGPAATAFIEAATGRRSTRLAVDALLGAQAIRSPAF